MALFAAAVSGAAAEADEAASRTSNINEAIRCKVLRP